MSRLLLLVGAIVLWLIGLQFFAPNVLIWSFRSAFEIALLALNAVALWLVPGAALLRLFWRDGKLPALMTTERITLSVGLGIALPPLLLLLSHQVGLKWSGQATYVYLLVCLVVVAFNRKLKLAKPNFALRDVVLIIVVLTTLIVRLFVARDLPSALFGDGFQHTMIAQLLVDNGGLFSSWQPYAPLTTFTYHFGFHANVAFFHAFTQTDVIRGALLVGQSMNAATCLVAFALVSRLTRLHGASESLATATGLFAATLTSFANTQPAFFVNWGRYTQLAGQIVLPVLLLCWAQLFENVRAGGTRSELARLIFLCGVVTACLILTHYIVTIFAALMVSAYWLAIVLSETKWRATISAGAIAVVAAAVALMLTAPWLQNTLGGYLASNTNAFISGDAGAQRIANYSALRPITPDYLNKWVLLSGLIGFAISLARREWRVSLLGVWALLTVLTVTPATVGLPGSGVVDSLTGYIALYVTVTPLAAYAFACGFDWVSSFVKQTESLLPLASILISVWGAGWQRDIVNAKAFQLLTSTDVQAMSWIRANTPKTTRFLVNSFPAYDGTLIAGNDGGWWLTFLTGRETNLPPLPYGTERGVREDKEIFARTVGITTQFRGKPLVDPSATRIDLTRADVLELAKQFGYTHIYIGANSAPEAQMTDRFDTTALRNSDNFKLVYEQDGVEIFEMR
jgi:hypothetical protein